MLCSPFSTFLPGECKIRENAHLGNVSVICAGARRKGRPRRVSGSEVEYRDEGQKA